MKGGSALSHRVTQGLKFHLAGGSPILRGFGLFHGSSILGYKLKEGSKQERLGVHLGFVCLFVCLLDQA